MRKLTLLFLSVVCVLCLAFSLTACGNIEQEGSQGLTYELSEDKESYTVVGIGSYDGNNLVIPSKYEGKPVTSIGQAAFYDCKKLTNVTIPNSVTTIGDKAFDGCFIKEITVPSIALSYITKDTLESVTITSGEDIPDSSFKDCKSLTSVTLPDGLTSIGENAFYNCTKLTSITIPNSVTTIGSAAFKFCEGLTSVNIPDGVTSIPFETFCNCKSLTSVTIGIGVTKIGTSAFQSCEALPSITIPSSVTSIGDLAFGGCNKLKSATFEDASEWFVREEYFSSEFNITVTDPSKNAEYLTKTYYYYTWKKVTKL